MSKGLTARIATRVGPLALDVELATTGTLAVIGPNGAGKTSLLSAILGVRRSERAFVEVDGTVLCDTAAGIDLPVEERRLGYVPQDYALFPHLTVRENVAFAVRSSSRRRSAGLDERVDAALASMDLTALAARNPTTLSGGEKQRVALARALSVEPRALLLDEPLAALDVHARQEVRAFLAGTLQKLALPTLVVTHDAHDVRALAGQVVVIEAGRVTQAARWDQCLAEPATRFVGEFFAGTSG